MGTFFPKISCLTQKSHIIFICDKIFLCAGGELDDCLEKMKDFLNYIAGGTESGDLSDRLREEVEKSKSKEKWRLDYMTLPEKYDEGKADGKAEGRAEMIRCMLGKGKTPEDIAAMTDVSMEEIRRLKGETWDRWI